MKKRGSILGDTPPFMTWSLRHDCRLKQHCDVADPQRVERALRTIRAASSARSEMRVVGEGQDAFAYQLGEDQELRIFRLDEVSRVHGEFGSIEELCQQCPANLDSFAAGCFGMLLQNEFPDIPDVSRFESSSMADAQLGMVPTNPGWFGLWTLPTWGKIQIEFLLNLLNQVEMPENENLQRFVNALERAGDSAMQIDIQSFPSGHSDGYVWTLFEHCPDCRADMRTDASTCRVCGRVGRAHPFIKRKVRGFRPFVKPHDILAEQDANQLVNAINRNESLRVRP